MGYGWKHGNGLGLDHDSEGPGGGQERGVCVDCGCVGCCGQTVVSLKASVERRV